MANDEERARRVRESLITTNQQRGMSPEQARENAQQRTERIMREQRDNKR